MIDLETKLNTFKLSYRVIDRLHAGGIDTVGQLIAKKESQVKALYGFGEKLMYELKRWMEKEDLKFQLEERAVYNHARIKGGAVYTLEDILAPRHLFILQKRLTPPRMKYTILEKGLGISANRVRQIFERALYIVTTNTMDYTEQRLHMLCKNRYITSAVLKARNRFSENDL